MRIFCLCLIIVDLHRCEPRARYVSTSFSMQNTVVLKSENNTVQQYDLQDRRLTLFNLGTWGTEVPLWYTSARVVRFRADVGCRLKHNQFILPPVSDCTVDERPNEACTNRRCFARGYLDDMGTLSAAFDKWGTICINSGRALKTL